MNPIASYPFADEDSDSDPADWFGAAKVRSSAEFDGVRPDMGMTFHVFRASSSYSLYAINATGDMDDLPPCPGNGVWQAFKKIPEAGKPRIGFSEAEAKSDIEKQGFHLVRVKVNTTERVVPVTEGN